MRGRDEIPNPKFAAFTLVELLVVITIIGILIALLLPAVQAAREAARRMQCANNFKQVGLALHNYHTALGCFPAGNQGYHPGTCAAPPGATKQVSGDGWSTYLLPYFEQRNVFDSFDFRESGGQDTDARASQNVVAVYLCPSDPQGRMLSHYGSQPEYFPHTTHAKTGMAGVADSRDHTCDGQWMRRDGNGMFFNNSWVRIADVADGTSNTLMVGEVVGKAGSDGGTYNGYPTGETLVWYYWNVYNTSNGINRYVPAKVIFGNVDTGFASYHPGGCHFLLGDGSVQFISQTIDAWTLRYLTTRRGGEVITKGW